MNKLSKRAISIIVIATFLLSMIPIMTTQAVMEDIAVSGYPDITNYPLDFTEQESDGGIVEWSELEAYRGSASIRLEIPTLTQASDARIMFDYDDTLESLSTISYYAFLEDSYEKYGAGEYSTPYVTLNLDISGDGNLDAWLVNRPHHTLSALGTWGLITFDDDSQVGITEYQDGIPNDWLVEFDTFAEMKADPQWKDVTVLEAKVGIGTDSPPSENLIAFVDDVKVNDVLYHFEVEGVDEGDTLTVSGVGVTSGATVNVYWDFVTTAGLANSTAANPDGSYDLDLEIPSDVAGDHYIWVKDVGTGETKMYPTAIFVVPKLSLSPSSGLAGDEVTVKGYGFSDENDVTIIWDSGVTDVVLTSSVETDEDGYVTYSFDVPTGTDYGDYYVTAVDDAGWTATKKYTVGASITLTPDEGPTGTVVTVEGKGWSEGETITFTIDGTIDVEVVDDATVTVGSDGEFTAEVVIPGMGSVTDYELEATESDAEINDPIDVRGPAHEDFDVTGIPEIVVSPTYGTPGATITVTGSNFTQIAGTEIILILDSLPDALIEVHSPISGTVETKSDGTFEDTFVSPAITFQTYTLTATDEYEIDADDAFKVGLIALIINPESGEAGTKTSITGIGFAAGVYNVTFTSSDGSFTKLYEDHGTVSGGEAISDLFYMPNVEPGTYHLTISDTEENELTRTFMVTESTYVIADPVVAPNKYNVSLKGYNFADIEDGVVDFVIYNVTAEGKVDLEEEMEVNTWKTVDNVEQDITTLLDKDGNFTGHWHVPLKDVMSLGDYTINVTDSKGLLVQIPFSIVAARVSVAPRKAQFDRGDMIQFDINNDFILPLSYIEIYSPSDILYWSTQVFIEPWWIPVEGLHTVPYYRQTAAGNPMELQSDAPMGTWLYRFFEDADTELMNGTFVVGASSAAQIDALLEDVRSDLAGLSDDLAGITDDVEDDLADLSDEIGGIVSDMGDLRDDIVGDLADDIARATDAGQSALDAVEDLASSMTDLGDAVGDIADIANDASDAAQSAADAANDAVSAAEEASQSASGLTTLVYGAIGASLIAALAAIISLMQISKKIAG